VFTSHLWGSPAVVSTDPEVSRAVLQADASAFVPWYPRSLMELMGKDSILVLSSALQRRVHGLAGAFFKSPQLKARVTADLQRRVGGALDSPTPMRVQDEAKSVRAHDSFLFLLQLLVPDRGERECRAEQPIRRSIGYFSFVSMLHAHMTCAREVVLHVSGIGRSPGIDDSCGRWEVSVVDAAFGAAWELAPVHFHTDNYSGIII
jgi:hypothetical protein